MNKKIVIIVSSIVIALLGLGIFAYVMFIRGIIPAIAPSRTDIAKTIEQTPNNIPLRLPEGFTISVFAKDLGSPRDLLIDSKGNLLASIPTQGKVVVLHGESQKTLLENLNSPHGLAFYQGKLFVAEETRVVRYEYDAENLAATQDKVLFSLPSGGRHTTRTIEFNNSGRMFVSIGSTCDTCEEQNEWNGSIISSNAEGENPKLWSQGLRNAVFIKKNPDTDELWVTEMGRDMIGDNIPPDEINIARENTHYGWPYCYGDQIWDTQFGKKDQAFCNSTELPVFKIQAHSAPLGLSFIQTDQFPQDWKGDLLVAYHGSWNRSEPTGYKIVRLDVDGNKIIKEYDFITGWLQGIEASGRPVDLEFDDQGTLYISDDKAGVIYKVVATK